MRYTGDPWPKLWFQWGEGLRVSAVGRGGTRAKKRDVFPFLIHSFTHFCKRGPARRGNAARTPARCVFWSRPEWGGLLGWTGGPTLALEKRGRQMETGASLEELRWREPLLDLYPGRESWLASAGILPRWLPGPPPPPHTLPSPPLQPVTCSYPPHSLVHRPAHAPRA